MLKKSIGFKIILMFLIIIRFFYKQNSDLATSTYQIKDPQIPVSFLNFKIVAISDLHNKSFGKNNLKLIRETHKLNPDIIVVTGDLISAYHPDKNIALSFINQASKIAPVYFVSGNHEMRLINYHEFEAELSHAGAIILDNNTTKIKQGKDYLHLMGLADPQFYYAKNSHSIFASQLDYLLALIDPAEFTILLSHRPELMSFYASRPINLVLSGHAHGGQFRLPFLGGIFAPNQGFLPKYSSGKYIMSETKMIVSRGLGPSSFPTRLNNKPDLVQVILNPSKTKRNSA